VPVIDHSTAQHTPPRVLHHLTSPSQAKYTVRKGRLGLPGWMCRTAYMLDVSERGEGGRQACPVGVIGQPVTLHGTQDLGQGTATQRVCKAVNHPPETQCNCRAATCVIPVSKSTWNGLVTEVGAGSGPSSPSHLRTIVRITSAA
jgi:hypothetical protein